jgi:hypothetical protein
MDKLTKLLSQCKCGVYLNVNAHRDNYETAELALDAFDDFVIEPEVRAKIIETNTLIDLHFYPDTPIGFYKVLHYDLEAAIDEALSWLGQ